MKITYRELMAKIAAMPIRLRDRVVQFVEPHKEFQIHDVEFCLAADGEIKDKDGKVIGKGEPYLY